MWFSVGVGAGLLLAGGLLAAFPASDPCQPSSVVCVGCTPTEKAWLVLVFGR